MERLTRMTRVREDKQTLSFTVESEMKATVREPLTTKILVLEPPRYGSTRTTGVCWKEKRFENLFI